MREPHIPAPNIHPTALILPGAHVHGQVTIDSDSIVLFGAVIRAELDRIDIGSETNIQDNSVVHCDEDIPARIGNRVTVGHAVVVHGAQIGDSSLLGIGSRVLNRATVGEGAWVGAGAVVAEGVSIPPWTLALGLPAKPVRDLTEAEIRKAEEGVDHYLQMADRYREIFD